MIGSPATVESENFTVRRMTVWKTVSPQAEPRRTSGRIRHDEKMTVYVTSDELHHLELTRLGLRATHGYAVDRGRLVREALAIVLADFDEHGADSVLVRRLSEA